jgi:hypothetical protein
MAASQEGLSSMELVSVFVSQNKQRVFSYATYNGEAVFSVR